MHINLEQIIFGCLFYKEVQFEILESIGTGGKDSWLVEDSVDEILFFQSNCCDYFNDCDSTLLGRRETKCRFVKNSLEDPLQLL